MAKVANMQKSLFWSFMEQGGAKAVQLIVQIVLARLLSPEAFGLVAILLVVTSLADSVAQSGFGMALIQKKNADDRAFNTAFWLSLSLSLLMCLVLYIAAPFVAEFYRMPDLVSGLRALSAVVVFNAVNSIQRSYLQRKMEFRGLFRVSLIAAVGSGAVGIACAFYGFGTWSLIAQSLSQAIFTCLTMASIVPWRPRFEFDVRDAIELYQYGWRVCITGILNVFYTGVSEMILGRTCTPDELGYYSQGRKYPNAAIGVISNAVANVLFPAFSEMKDDMNALRACMRKGLVLGTFVLAPISMCAASIAVPVVGLLLGDEWIPASLVFAVTCASNVITVLQLVNLRAYMALGRSDLYMNLQFIKVALGIVVIGGVAFLTRDIYATSIATLFVSFAGVILVDMVPARRIHGYSMCSQLKDVSAILLASGLAYGAAIFVGSFLHTYIPMLLAQCIVYFSVYLIASFALRVDAARGLLLSIRRMKGGPN